MTISRRTFLATAGATLQAQQSPARPNIILLLADDMGWSQVGFTGGKEVATPHIDSIARDGVTLTQFYVQPVCTPTRGCLMTGRYAWKTGTEIRPSTLAAQGMLRDERTIAQALGDAGYATWMVGKWHLGEWHREHLPRSRGFQHHYGHYGALIDSFTHMREGILDWHRNGKPIIEEGYSTFLLAQEATRLISSHDGKKPFFLYLPFNAVHGPHQAPPEYVKKYEKLGGAAAQRAQLECMDIAVGQVLDAVRQKGIERETLVMFTNDNGGPGMQNGIYKGMKSAYHEGGMRVPAALRWPGKIAPGSRSDAMLHAVDLFPTFCQLAGADPAKGLPLDGKDAWAAIAKKARSPREEIAHSLQVIRSGDFKLIEQGASYYNWTDQPLQLYNIRLDPSEKENLAARHPEIVAKLRARLAYHKQFARTEEPQERIPNSPPAVYGEDENAQHGDWVRSQIKARGLSEPATKQKRRKQKV